MKKKILIALLVVALLVVYKVFNLGQYLSLSYLKASHERFMILYAEHRIAVILAYMAAYILVTALSLPGAVPMTLIGGALFGFWLGTVVVSFSSAIGATLACFVARFLLREWVQKRVGDRLKAVNVGIEKEGKFYLFSLRLIPIFPFFMINLVMGLTRMPLFTFYWVSQIGMLPGTMVYVNAGKELAEIDSLSGIFSPGLIVSFVLLGLFPLITRKLLGLYRSRRETIGSH
jgi:uncharacterized membrane protein YdjX (TVP38/TMEM64 family)